MDEVVAQLESAKWSRDVSTGDASSSASRGAVHHQPVAARCFEQLGFNVRRTMGVAQRLYEGVEIGAEGTVGLITYMRTDSTRVAPEAITGAREWIGKLG